MTRLAVAGAAGRMGRCVMELAATTQGVEVVCGLVAPSSPDVGRLIPIADRRLALSEKLDVECDVLLDVSMPMGTAAWLSYCERREIPMVIGVTGHTNNQMTRIREAAHQIPIVLAANFSIGLNAILAVLEPLIRRLGDGYDVEIVETHHRNKVDAPSGTALTIVEEIKKARHSKGGDEPRLLFGREGSAGPRSDDEIAVHAVRMGDVVGRHEIHLSGPGETITITHAAHSRSAFAAGALRAAQWVVQQGAGFYTMRDVLAIPPPPTPGPRVPDPDI